MNAVYLPDSHIPDQVRATGKIEEALERAEFVILAAPSHATRAVLRNALPLVNPGMIFVSATKGIEIDTGKRISQIVAEVVGEKFSPRFVCLSGPSFAKEVVENHPTAVVAASSKAELSRSVQEELSSENLAFIRTMTSSNGTRRLGQERDGPRRREAAGMIG